MANSSIIENAKNKIIKEFIKDIDIVKAINSAKIPINETEKLIGEHIFDYHQNPNTMNDIMTFITIQVHIPESFYNNDDHGTFVKPIIEIWIISHEKHMKVDNIPKIKSNRNDYLSRLIDNRLNKRSGFGIGKTKLKSNVEGSYQQNYLFRKMTFECTDLNDSLCEDDE